MMEFVGVGFDGLFGDRGMDFESEEYQKRKRLLERKDYDGFLTLLAEEKLDEDDGRRLCRVAMDAPEAVMDAICQQVQMEMMYGFEESLFRELGLLRHYMRLLQDFVEEERVDWLGWLVRRVEAVCQTLERPMETMWQEAINQEKPLSLGFLLERIPREEDGFGMSYSERMLWARQGMAPHVDACLEVLRRYRPCHRWEELGYSGLLTVDDLVTARNFPLLCRFVEHHGVTKHDWAHIIQGVVEDWWSERGDDGEMQLGQIRRRRIGPNCDQPLAWLEVLDVALERQPEFFRRKQVRGLVAALRLDEERGNDPRILHWVKQMGRGKVYLTVEEFSWCAPNQGLCLWEERMPSHLRPAIDRFTSGEWTKFSGRDRALEMVLERCQVDGNRSKRNVSQLAQSILNNGPAEIFLRQLEPDGILYTEPREALLRICRGEEWCFDIPRNRQLAVETLGKRAGRFEL